ncbi:PREDICTED: tRNA (guanine(37)-N1)-methyltransferase 1 [Nicotiana attenuata]|uniref:tRNA (guanine(37)-N1)-methyltransferase n=1 Tax=Nicotiana attenuata TaxID=49451 RepID=A0A1J6K1D8_NICAT|nr:PREDICTED: tRNA (guanine(37)-N1)-methyltransferase 1 [Nicotiana attenuata]OIT23842.1 trna (guanine(37)-n1)-methyltransferase 1 [Nicotiana attenuata]
MYVLPRQIQLMALYPLPSAIILNKIIVSSTSSLHFTYSFFPKPLTPSLFSTTTAAAATSSSTLFQPHSYGPSLYKGHKVHQNTDNFDEDNFTRVFDITALRVPSEHCFSLESKLRGHLLNWPRIRNIARVPGDDIDDELKEFIGNNNDTETLTALERRIYGKAEGDGEKMCSVLYRDKLARTFNSTGYVKFQNLAKLSRPKKSKKKREEKEESGRQRKGLGRNEMALVEVVEEEGSGDEDLSGLLGDDFIRRRKWSGSTRLLLLDERYANKRIEELPEAIKAVLKEHNEESTRLSFEIVRCKLTLFYNYWQMNEVLEVLLPQGMIVPSAFETVGHIAHLNLRDEHLPYKKLIAKVVLDKNKPKIQTVANKIDAIHNDYRTMQLEVLAGNHSLVTTVVENGLYFDVDLATVYWNSRLATERQRLLSCFTHDDVVCDVFAGIGPIAISAAKKVKYVYANDLNPSAVEYLERNCVRNKLERKIEIFNMDGRRFIDSIFASEKTRAITQVVMNLPNDAAEFLDSFRGIFGKRNKGTRFTLPRIHVYGFSKAQDPEFDFHEQIRIALSEVAFEVEMRKVRLVAPGKWMLCASFVLPETVAFSK